MPYADETRRLEYQKQWRDGRKDKKRAYDAVYGTAYYAAHKQQAAEYARLSRVKDANRSRQRRKAAWWARFVDTLKRAQGCASCGTREGLLVHHHIDPGSTKYRISQMHSRSIESFVDELAKCTVLCARCHSQAHREQS